MENYFNINYYNQYNEINNNNIVYSIIITKKFLITSEINSLKIFDINNYKLVKILENNDENPNDNILIYITLLKNSNLAYSKGNFVKILNIENFEIKSLKGHSQMVIYVHELKNNNLASSSFDQTIIIWENKNNNYEIYKILKGHKFEVSPLLEINNNLLVSSSFNEKIIKIWDLNYYINICSIECLCTGWAETILLYNKNYLIIAGLGLYILDLIHYKILKHFKIENNKFIKFIKKVNNNIYLTGDGSQTSLPGNLIQWKVIKKLEWVQEKKITIHDLGINAIIILDNNNIMITGSNDGKIKIWKKNKFKKFIYFFKSLNLNKIKWLLYLVLIINIIYIFINKYNI